MDNIIRLICTKQELFDFLCDDNLLGIKIISTETQKRINDIISGKILPIDDPESENDGNFPDGFLYEKLPAIVDDDFIKNHYIERGEAQEIIETLDSPEYKNDEKIYNILRSFTPQQLLETIDYCPCFLTFIRRHYRDIYLKFHKYHRENRRFVPEKLMKIFRSEKGFRYLRECIRLNKKTNRYYYFAIDKAIDFLENFDFIDNTLNSTPLEDIIEIISEIPYFKNFIEKQRKDIFKILELKDEINSIEKINLDNDLTDSVIDVVLENLKLAERILRKKFSVLS